jgi:hypothetical protein
MLINRLCKHRDIFSQKLYQLLYLENHISSCVWHIHTNFLVRIRCNLLILFYGANYAIGKIRGPNKAMECKDYVLLRD